MVLSFGPYLARRIRVGRGQRGGGERVARDAKVDSTKYRCDGRLKRPMML